MKPNWARGSETYVRGSARKRLRKQSLIIQSQKGRRACFRGSSAEAESTYQSHVCASGLTYLSVLARRENLFGEVFCVEDDFHHQRLQHNMLRFCKDMPWDESYWEAPVATGWFGLATWLRISGTYPEHHSLSLEVQNLLGLSGWVTICR